jgi:amidohydrolase
MKTSLTESERNELIGWRRDFHAHPELGYEETRTSSIVAQHLRDCGYEVSTGVAGTGVVGLLNGTGQGRTIMLRADMDCLPVQEQNDVPYRSKVEGKMHACGHDGHTAVLMEVARKLMQRKNTLKGNVKLVFQPAEEGGNGAERMIQEGVLENPKVDATFGLHIWTTHPVGKIALNRGALMAGVHQFEATIIGKGGHGAAPHQTVDALVTAAQAIVNLQTVVSRNINPLDTAVVTVGSIHAGNVFNVIAERATFLGTARYFNPKVGEQLPESIERVIRGTAESMGALYELKYDRLTLPTINNPKWAEFIQEIGSEVVGADNVVMDARTMGGEDMAFFLNEVPGCYFFIGGSNPERHLDFPHHSSRFDFDEGCLEIGVEVLCRAVERYLSQG